MKGPLQRQLHVHWWKVKDWLTRRLWQEGLTELYLIACKLVSKAIPGANMPVHGRLYLKVFRAGPELPGLGTEDVWRCVRIHDDGKVTFETPNGFHWTVNPESLEALEYGHVEDYGCVGCHLIVTAGKNYVAGCFNNTNEAENLKFHGYGSGATAPAAGDTALQTEYTTQYATDNTRPTGSQSVSTNIYTTIGTFSPDAGVTVTEWGLLSQAATGGGTLFDRQTFTGVALSASADSLQTTYALTCG